MDDPSRPARLNAVAGYARNDLQLSGKENPVRLIGFAVSAGFFHVLGAKPVMGREFSTNDELPASGRVVILSHRLWPPALVPSPISWAGE